MISERKLGLYNSWKRSEIVSCFSYRPGTAVIAQTRRRPKSQYHGLAAKMANWQRLSKIVTRSQTTASTAGGAFAVCLLQRQVPLQKLKRESAADGLEKDGLVLEKRLPPFGWLGGAIDSESTTQSHSLSQTGSQSHMPPSV